MPSKLLASIALAALLPTASACTSVSQSTRLSVSLSAEQFNDLSSAYSPRPTFVTLEAMTDGQTVLAIGMQQYGQMPSSSIQPNFQFRLLRSSIPQYLALMDKFDTWRSQALARGDAITKVLGRAPTWGQVSGVELEFTFHSGNANQHFLVIATCAMGTCLENQALVFDSENVTNLRALLAKWNSDQLKSLDTDSIYH